MIFGLTLALAFLPFSTALQWDDFTNNLATDLAPLIALFGEQVTKQFLSESLSTWDNVIFAMAPLGILTAVVSAIRVCGSSSLRAFIGRAQESPGTAEVELLSCTSETTSELWHEGGIARVFGAPQILEVVRTETKDSDYQDKDYKDKDGKYTHEHCTAGIDLFDCACGRNSWEAVKGPGLDPEKRQYHRPNLSLNVGIKRQPKKYTYAAAACGVILQTGVLVFAGLSAYRYPTRFLLESDGKQVENYAFPMTLVGTLLLCFGMFLCAFIVEQSTNETHFKKKDNSDMYWVQPGGQKIGDQVFKSFVGRSTDSRYIISSRAENRNRFDGRLWATVIATILGFIVQFVGLRAMHSSVIMAQLGATLLMSIIRAGLRTQRVAETRDMIALRNPRGRDDRNSYQDHELDFLAMELERVKTLIVSRKQGGTLSSIPFQDTKDAAGEAKPPEAPKIGQGIKALKARARLARLTSEEKYALSWKDIRVREIASQLQTAIEGVMEILSARFEGADAKVQHFHWPVNICCAADDETFRLRLWKEGLAWKMDCSELEALIGMWTWSLLSRKSNEGRRVDTSNIRLIAAVDVTNASLGEAQTWYQAWIQRRLVLQPPRDLDRVVNLLSYFEDLTGIKEHKPTVWTIGGSPLFGCHPEDKDLAMMLYVQTQNSTLRMCAQDLFISFLRTALKNIKDIGGKTTIRTSSDRQGTLLLKNSRIEEMANHFENSGLGSREDAYMCIIPLLMRRSKLPGMTHALSALREHIKVYKSEDKFKEAEQLIQWICSSPGIPEDDKPYVELAELYRTAMRHQSQDIRAVGFKGVCGLLKQSSSQSRESTVFKLAQQYGWIGLRIAAEIGDGEAEEKLKNSGAREDVVSDYTTDGKLWYWAEKNNTTVMRYLIGKEGCHVDCEGSDGRTSLFWAAMHGNIDIATLLLDNNANRNLRDRDGRTPLSYAAEKGHHVLVGILLNGDTVSLNIGVVGKTPLILAAKNGHEECVRVLLKVTGIRLNIPGPGRFDKCGALEEAIAGNHHKVAELLIERNADYHPWKVLLWAGKGGYQRIIDLVIEKGLDCKEVLQVAAEEGFSKVVESLIKKRKVDLNVHGKRALERAIQKGHQPVAELLIKQIIYREGSLLEAAKNGHHGIVGFLIKTGVGLPAYSGVVGIHDTSEAEEALEVAATAGHTKIVELLIEKGVSFGGAALQGAAKMGHSEVVELLIKMGVDVSTDGGYALELAAGAGHEKIVELLIENGVDVLAHGPGALKRAAVAGFTKIVTLLIEKKVTFEDEVFEKAVEGGRWGVVEILIEKGARLEKYGRKALELAAVAGKDGIVNQLIMKKVDFGGTLQQAVKLGHRKIVERLLEAGADVDGGDIPALTLAIQKGQLKIAELLIKYGANVNAKGGCALASALARDHWRAVELLINNGADINASEGLALKLRRFKGNPKMKALLVKNGVDSLGRMESPRRSVRFEDDGPDIAYRY